MAFDPNSIVPVTIDDFTTGEVAGTGVFDSMMQTVQKHVQQEYKQNRIKGVEYSTVYLGALTSTMDRALNFLLTKDKVALEAALLALEIDKLEIEKDKLAAEVLLVNAQVRKVDAEILLAEAQTAKAEAELSVILAQKDKTRAEISLINAQVDQIAVDMELTRSKTTLTNQQGLNAVIEGRVLDAQECKLRAEFDLITVQIPKVVAETGVLNQKKITEQAQTSGTGVGQDSVIGKQLVLYTNQAEGFLRKSELDAAKEMISTWNVRRTTDETTAGSTVNKLNDDFVGKAVDKMLKGVGAL